VRIFIEKVLCNLRKLATQISKAPLGEYLVYSSQQNESAFFTSNVAFFSAFLIGSATFLYILRNEPLYYLGIKEREREILHMVDGTLHADMLLADRPSLGEERGFLTIGGGLINTYTEAAKL
jgi:hypothetical protein